MKTNQNHYLNFIYFLIITYSFIVINSTIEPFDIKNISAQNTLFRGEFIKWLESSVVSSGRFVPFSNTGNILLSKITDNIKYFIILKICLVILNFFLLKKIFDYLKISKYFIFGAIIICYNHAFLNGQYITSAEGDLSLLLTTLFYLDLKKENKEIKFYEHLLKIFLIVFLLGIKESMIAFFIAYTFLKIFYFKKDNFFLKLSYITIIILYFFFLLSVFLRQY